jgi:hypothetical protein
MTAGLIVLAAASLAWSIVATARSGPFAYYGLHTRAWELAAGGILALVAGTLARVPRRIRTAAGVVGLGIVIASAFGYDASTSFPGAAALVPVVGTVLVVAAGIDGTVAGVGRFLATRPMTYVGRLSYGWYLWHWPVLVFVGAVTAAGLQARPYAALRPAHGRAALAALAVSFLLSAASHRLVENPIRYSGWLAQARARSLALGAMLTAVSVAAVTAVLPATDGRPAGPVLAPVAAVRPSQAPKVSRATDHRVMLRMTPAQAREDEPPLTRECYVGYFQTAASGNCLFGDRQGKVTLALVGDSHAEQWYPALEHVALQRHWRLWVWTKSACPMVALPVRLPQFHGAYPWCDGWRENVMARLAALPRLDAIVVSHYGSLVTRGSRFGGEVGEPLSADELPTAWRRAWTVTGTRLAGYARRVIVIRDVPKPSTDVPACLAEHGTDARPCSFPRALAFARADLTYDAERLADVPRQRFVDFDDLLCPGQVCPVVAADGTIVFRDNHHLTAAMSRDLAPVAGRRIARAMR